MAFTERLKALLEMRGLSTSWLARRSGISQRHINALLSGERISPSIEVASAIAQALGVSLDWLAGLEPQDNITLLPEEEYLVALYRGMPDERGKRLAIEAIRA